MTDGRKLFFKSLVVLVLGIGTLITEPTPALAVSPTCGLQPECISLTECELQECPEACPEVNCLYGDESCIGGATVYHLYCGGSSTP